MIFITRYCATTRQSPNGPSQLPTVQQLCLKVVSLCWFNKSYFDEVGISRGGLTGYTPNAVQVEFLEADAARLMKLPTVVALQEG